MSNSEAEPSELRVSTEDAGPVTCTLVVEVDANRVERAFDRAYRDLGRRVRVPGFRPGKVPRKVLERLYGAAVAEDLERTLVAETLPEAIRRSELDPVTEPSVDAPTPAVAAPFRYTARIEMKPQITLPELTGLPAKEPRVEVVDADVDRQLETLRQRHASLLEVAEETPVAQGHVVTVDFQGSVDGQPFEGGSGRDVEVEIGSGRFLAGFEDQLVGARAGETRQVRAPLPEEHENRELAGKEALFEVRVTEVKYRSVPELDDEFAKDLGDFANLAELRDRIREELGAAGERSARAALRRSLLDVLIERTPFEVPPGLVERQLEHRLAQAHRELEKSVPPDVLQGQLGKWREEWRPQAEREVREDLLLERVARERGIEIQDADLDERLTAMARAQGVDPGRLRKVYRDSGMLEALRAGMAREKALDFLIDEAKVEETTDT
jgi:trigger factor